MHTQMSYQPPCISENTESGGQGPIALMPRAFAISMAGLISSISSMPNRPFSPQCGLRPATATRGFSMPRFLQASLASSMHSRTRGVFTRSQASRRLTWVETCTTRKSWWASIIVYFLVCV